MMTNVPPEEPRRVLDFAEETARIRRGLGEATAPAAPPIDVGGGGPHPPGMDIGERLARLEAGQDWIKVILSLLGAFVGLLSAIVIGGFAFLGVQMNRLDSKVDALPARISAENAQTRQELVGIANAISNSITAAKQVQPQIVIVPAPVPGATPTPNLPPKR